MAPSSLRRLALAGMVALLVLAAPAPATAQTSASEREQARLKGVTDVGILIEELDDADDIRCGISEGQLNAAVTKALLDNGIGIRLERPNDRREYKGPVFRFECERNLVGN